MSASASGPIGWLQPSFIPSSISSALASPSCSASTASLIIGQRIRLTTKPGLFLTTIGVLPSAFASATAASTVASSVRRPRISSTSAIIGTGLKKCMPMNFPGRDVAAASRVMEIDDVFVARITPGRASASTCSQDLDLELLVLGGGLDDEVAALQRVVARRALRCASARHPCPPPRSCPSSAADRGSPAIGREPARHRGVGDVHHHDIEAGDGARLRDAVAHRSGADDADRLDCAHGVLAA